LQAASSKSQWKEPLMIESSGEFPKTKSRVKEFFMMALLWLPFIHCCCYTLTYAKDAPFGERIYIYYFLKPMLSGSLDWLQVLTYQQNEYRVGIPTALCLTLAQLTHFNTLFEIYAGLLVMAGIVAVLILYCAKAFRSESIPLFATLPVTWLACTVRQTENLLFSFHNFFFVSCFFFLLCVFHASKLGRVGPRLFISIVFAFLSSFSSANGLLSLPLGFAAMVCNGGFRCATRHTRIALIAMWIFGGIFLISAYFWQFDFTCGRSDRITWDFFRHNSVSVVEFFLGFLGSPITYDPATAVAIGYIFVGITIFSSVILFKSRHTLQDSVVFPLVLLAYGIISAAMASVGRSHSGLIGALSPRYAGFAGYAWIGLYLSVLLAKHVSANVRYCVLGTIVSVLFIGAFTVTRFEQEQGSSWLDRSLRMENIIRTYKQQGKSALKDLNADFPDFVPVFCKFLEENRLSVFSRPSPQLAGAQRNDAELINYDYGIDEINGEPVATSKAVPTLNVDLAMKPELFIKGWSRESKTHSLPGAVFLLIDDKLLLLTASGLSRNEFLQNGLMNNYFRGFGFESSFRTNLLKPGIHSIKLAILDSGEMSYSVTPDLVRINVSVGRPAK
jgi:hypothetical protein